MEPILDWKKLLEKEEELQAFEKELEERKTRFLKEKQVFQRESDLIKHSIVSEQQKLKQDNLFFEKKMEILKGGFAQLEADRRSFEQEKQQFERQKAYHQSASMFHGEDISEVFFQGVNNILVLKKRYRDLCKIFHPDNVAGDQQMFRMITQEYEKRLEDYKNKAVF